MAAGFHQNAFPAKKNVCSHRPAAAAVLFAAKPQQLLLKPGNISGGKPNPFPRRTAPRDRHTRRSVVVQSEDITSRTIVAN
jgi:hypothetical protein